jgi:hypothetical protein
VWRDFEGLDLENGGDEGVVGDGPGTTARGDVLEPFFNGVANGFEPIVLV